MGALACADLHFSLLNDWQHDFPIVDTPFATIGAACGVAAEPVIAAYRELLADGAISRIGGVWGAGAAGAALLCAFAVPKERLEAVAALVSALPGVNHNYEREHRFNLWFVVTGRNATALDRSVDTLEAQTGCRALRLRMQRAYRIDLGFDLRGATAGRCRESAQGARPIEPADEPLAALVEDGVPLLARPYETWGEALCLPGGWVRATLERWLREGTLRRFGVIVRHHEAGYRHNAMTVFDVADDIVDACGELLAGQRGVTLAYRRERADGWPYNLYCMVHGRDRPQVEAAIAAAIEGSGLRACASAVLFSRRRFKQSGARYFGARRFAETSVA
ncbi:MAG: siroheme decarboxylase subunit beta [Caldimonas sp.]